MTPTIKIRLLLMGFALSSATVLAPVVNAQDKKAIQSGQVLLRELVSQTAPGAAVAVWRDGKPIWSQGFGWADIKGKRPATAKTLFRIGSVSKPLAAAAAARLIEEGKIKVDGDVRAYVPSFTPNKHTVTMRQLGGHTSGVRHYRLLEFKSNIAYKNVVDPIAVFGKDKLLFPPGAKYSYTTYGWTVISAAVASASGKPFLEYMSRTVLTPLGMKDTMPDLKNKARPERPAFYRRSMTGKFIIADTVDLSNKWAGGGYLSTANDIAKFATAHARPGFHKKKTLELLFTPCRLNSGKQTSYGFGWSVKNNKHGKVVGHTGGSVGGTCLMKMWLKPRLVVVVLTNVSNGKLGKLGSKIGAAFLE